VLQEKPDEKSVHEEKPDEKQTEKTTEKPVDQIIERSIEQPDEKITETPSEEPAERMSEKPIEEPTEKNVQKLDENISVSSTEVKQDESASLVDRSIPDPEEDHVESAAIVIQSGIRTYNVCYNILAPIIMFTAIFYFPVKS
jgi:hypothetical protein